MTTKPTGASGSKVGVGVSYDSSSQNPNYERGVPLFGLVITSVVGTGVAWAFGLSASALLPAVLAGILVGWLRRTRVVRGLLGETIASTLFGQVTHRDNRLPFLWSVLVFGTMGYAVGVVFEGVGHAGLSLGSAALVAAGGGAGGGGGGGGGSLLEFLFAWLLLFGLVAVAGIVVMLLFDAAMRVLLADVAKEGAVGASEAVVEDAAARVVDRKSAVASRAAIALQGASTAILTALVLRAFCWAKGGC
jgi:hypothetical protein